MQRPMVGLPRHIWIPWLSGLTALTFYLLTVLYASQSTLLSQIRFVGSSPSYTILVLRVLSEIASLLLATTIAAVFQRLQSMLVSRSSHGGMRLTDYLGLEAGTGVLGLLSMALGTGVSKMTTRVWGTIRLVSIIIVPLLNILIMGKSLLNYLFLIEIRSIHNLGSVYASVVSILTPKPMNLWFT